MVECSASSNNEDAGFLKPKQQQQQQQLSDNSEQHQQTQSQESQQQNDTNQQSKDQQNLEQHQENQNDASDNTKQQQQADPQTQQKQQANKLTEELFSTKGWGDTPIRQDTAWELPPSPSATANDSATNASGSSAHGLGPSNSSNLLGSGSTVTHHNQISSLNHNQPSPLSSLATTAVVPPGSGNQLLNHANSSSLANTHSTLAQQVGNLVGGDNGHSTLPPGISQSGDNNNFRARNDFNSHSMINNFGVDNLNTANGLANSLGHMSIGGSASIHQQASISSRFEQQHQQQAQQQSWRAGPTSMVNKQHQQSSIVSASPFGNPNLMPKSMLNPGNAAAAVAQAGFGIGGRQASSGGLGDFARAPGPTSSSLLDNNKNKPYAGGAPNRSSTWSAFGTSAYSDSNSEWPKSSGISVGGQAPTPFDLAPDFGEQASKGWPNSMLMKSLEDSSAMNANPAAAVAAAAAAAAIGSFPGGSSYAASSSKSPTDASNGGQNDSSGIGTWSPVVKTGRPGSKWDSDGSDNGRGDSSRFDDGTSIWGSPFPTKVTGSEWGDKSGNGANGNVDEQQQKQEQQSQQRNIAGNNQAYRSPQLQQQHQQSSAAASMMMSSNYSPPTQHQQQHNRNQQQQQGIKQPNNLSQTFEQANALTNQASQPNRGLGMSPSSNIVPSTQQLKHMVQQIQLAVQAGHLNPQILNQPLSPVTLQLLCQLLQQIKVLHQFQMQASKQHYGGNKSQQQQQQPGNHPAALNVQITKTKQNIINLQNQIAAQQANYLKTQQQAHNISSTSAAVAARHQQQGGAATMPTLAAAAAAASSSIGIGGHNLGSTLPPGISQSGDNNFRTGNDFHSQSMINNYNLDNDMGPNGLASSLAGHMNLTGAGGAASGASRFDQSWRAPMVKHQHQHQQQPSMATSSTSPFANPNLMNHSSSSMPKSMLNCGPGGGLGNGGPGVGLQSAYGAMQGDFARAPGPTSSSMMDNNNKNKPFGVATRSTTWSAFGPNSAPNDSDSEWPKSSAGSIAASGSGQHNAVDMVPEFEPGKPWRGSMLMKSVEDDPTMTPASLARSLAPQRKTIWSDEIL